MQVVAPSWGPLCIESQLAIGRNQAGPAGRSGDLVTVSLTAANRDPAVFADPDRLDIRRPNARAHLAFATGPHFCPGAQLARTETVSVLRALCTLPGLHLPDPPAPHGLVFRKPVALPARFQTVECGPSAPTTRRGR
jgi:cytochrome P450